MTCEASLTANFSILRYAQCWEDADVLLDGLDIQPNHVCLSIASAGDNTLAMLANGPRRIVALDCNPAQLACLELRVAAYRELEHTGLLELIGSLASRRRGLLYQRCRSLLSGGARRFWDTRAEEISLGIGCAGKFERYLATFRDRVLPWVHSAGSIERLLSGGSLEKRQDFYRECWDTWKWRRAFKIFFSRFVMGRLGRDPSFFRHVEGGIAGRLLARTQHALTTLDPAVNPYLQWILTGRHVSALPYALRPENFQSIRENLDRLEWRSQSLGEFLSTPGEYPIDRFNLSDVFEYMSLDNYTAQLRKIAAAGAPGARLAYWNLLAERRRPEDMSGTLRSSYELADRLHQTDKAFFYGSFVLEEVL